MRALFGIGFLVLGLFAVGEGILVGIYGIRSFWTGPPIDLLKTPGEITLLSAFFGTLIALGGVGFLYLSVKAFLHKAAGPEKGKSGKRAA